MPADPQHLLLAHPLSLSSPARGIIYPRPWSWFGKPLFLVELYITVRQAELRDLVGLNAKLNAVENWEAVEGLIT